MPARFTVLASGSAGNASLLEAGGFGLLVDCGLGPRVLAWRLAAVGLSWRSVHAVLLTHTHGDHWNQLTLAHLRSLGVPLYAHALHHDFLSRFDAHATLRKAGLLRTFAEGE
jgi:glyoxylase-like metal-dependent hydrolase (beta-lactamase superfamily II)